MRIDAVGTTREDKALRVMLHDGFGRVFGVKNFGVNVLFAHAPCD